MGNFNRGGGGGGDRANRKPGGGMFQAVCSECHKSCEVPFRPTGEKPVYCKDCFAKRGGGLPRRDDRSSVRDFGANRRQDQGTQQSGGDDVRRLLEAINSKLGRLINVAENLAHVKLAPNKEQQKLVSVAPVAAPTGVVEPVISESVKAKIVAERAKKNKEVKKTAAKKTKK